ncbi:hypothetical protein FPQ18DRAFT_300190 [Pyronema domesticum]|nr:hypothetical protein FPQ18DRAFT_300190 [Pyronema domesticum]
MSDPLSIAASVAGLISLANEIGKIIASYSPSQNPLVTSEEERNELPRTYFTGYGMLGTILQEVILNYNQATVTKPVLAIILHGNDIRSDNGTNSTFKELIQKYSDVLRVNFIDGIQTDSITKGDGEQWISMCRMFLGSIRKDLF